MRKVQATLRASHIQATVGRFSWSSVMEEEWKRAHANIDRWRGANALWPIAAALWRDVTRGVYAAHVRWKLSGCLRAERRICEKLIFRCESVSRAFSLRRTVNRKQQQIVIAFPFSNAIDSDVTQLHMAVGNHTTTPRRYKLSVQCVRISCAALIKLYLSLIMSALIYYAARNKSN